MRVETRQAPPEEGQIRDAVNLTRQEHYAKALKIFETSLPTLTQGDLQSKRLAAGAFSFYGLCVAMVNRKYSQGVEYCKVSIKSNFLDPDHRYNLAMVYLERGDRKKAVETLNAGLRVQPGSTKINSVLDIIGRRRPPVIRFLGRSNPVNIWLGKVRARLDASTTARR